MEVKVKSKELNTEIGYAVSIIEQKVTIPILSHISLKSEKNFLEIASTDLDVTFKTKIPCETIVEGGIAVNSKNLSPVIKGFLEDGELMLKLTPERKLKISALQRKADYLFNTLPQEDFPRLLEPEEKGITLPYEVFRGMVKEALVSTGKEDTRFSVVGLLFVLEKNKLTMVSTDSHRLSVSSRVCDFNVENTIRVIVPKKVLLEALKLEKSETINIFIKDSQIFFLSGDRILYSRLKDFKFPAYEKVIPNDVTNVATVDKTKFVEVINRLLYLADAESRGIYIDIKKEGTMHLEARNESGEGGEEIFEVLSYSGEDVRVALNGEYLLEFCSSIGDEKILIKLKDTSSQCLLEAFREQSENICQNVVMPLRIES